jgi:phage terminase large subunit-like protein
MAQAVFVPSMGERAVRFVSNLQFVEGEWAGRPFRLESWQSDDIVRPLFGTINPDTNMRRYRTAFVAIPRKNSKTTIAAALALYLLVMDGEPGAQVYSAAADRDQASITFRIAAEMVKRNKFLRDRIQIVESRKRMIYHANASYYEALSSDVDTSHGLNAHAVVFDELHTQPNRDLYDVLKTSMGTRRQPLMLEITTAGYDYDSLCREHWEYAEKILDGTITDPSFFARIWAAGANDDWKDPEVWRKANPNLGVSIKEEFLRDECARAINSPSYQNTFRRLFLNQWTQQNEVWIDMDVWHRSGAGFKFDDAALAGRDCYGGLDLASTTDLAAFVLAFPSENGFILRPRFYLPSVGLRERIDRDRVPYDAWARDGLLTLTPSAVIDYNYIRADVKAAAQKFNLVEIAYDRWNATQIVTDLTDDGHTMIQFGQGFASMSPAAKEFYRILLEGRVLHGENPILNWMAGNVQVKSDASGNIKPDKSNSTSRIDGIVAAIMALDRAMRNSNGQSVYEERGIREL